VRTEGILDRTRRAATSRADVSAGGRGSRIALGPAGSVPKSSSRRAEQRDRSGRPGPPRTLPKTTVPPPEASLLVPPPPPASAPPPPPPPPPPSLLPSLPELPDVPVTPTPPPLPDLPKLP
jgi:hypothetical protein